MKKLALAAALTLCLAALPTTAHAETLGCNDEAVQPKPVASPPFKVGGNTIHFGYEEWHFPPSCSDDLRRDWVKIYRAQSGPNPRVYYDTTGERTAKSFKDGTYGAKVQYSYRYYLGEGKHGAWQTFTVSKRILLK